MKKTILFTFILIAVSSLQAQITINRNHLIVSGSVAVQSTDTNTYAVQTGGANKTWNLSGLKTISVDTQKFNPPQWCPGYTYFPNANLSISSSSDDSSFTFIKINNSELTFEGGFDLLPDTFEVVPFKSTILTFPSTYNTTFSSNNVTLLNTFPLGADLDSSGPIPFIDSIRISADQKVKSTIEGWGSITTPLGTYNALLQSTRNINGAKLEMFTSGIWITIPANVANMLGLGTIITDTSYQHQFWTNDATVGFPIVSYGFSQGQTTTRDVSWLQTKPNMNGISDNSINNTFSFYPNPCHTSFNASLPNNVQARLSIYDLNGRLVKDIPVTNGSLVDVSAFDNGVYTMKFTNESNGETLQVKKLIKY